MYEGQVTKKKHSKWTSKCKDQQKSPRRWQDVADCPTCCPHQKCREFGCQQCLPTSPPECPLHLYQAVGIWNQRKGGEIALSLGLADIWGYLQEWRPPAVWLFEAPCIRERTTVLLLWDYPVFRLRMKDKPRDKVTHPKWKSSFSACEFWSPVYKKCCLFKIYCRYSSPTLLLPITAFTVAAWDQSS